MKQLIKLWISSTGFDEMTGKQKKSALACGASIALFLLLYPLNFYLAILSSIALIYFNAKDIPVRE